MPHGHAGKILWVDLTSGRCRSAALDPDPDFIGGRGINQRRLFDLQPEGKDGLDPQSPILLSAGPLVGTLVPGACRLAVDFRLKAFNKLDKETPETLVRFGKEMEAAMWRKVAKIDKE
jgi:hypothetical protein